MLGKIFTTVKYTLVVVNVLLLITGIIVIAVGSSVQTAYNTYYTFLEARFFSLPAFLIATGVIIFLISLLGFYGAFTENYYVIMVYVGAMVIIFIFQFSAMIAGYALRGNAIAIIEKKLLETLQLYNTGGAGTEVTELWDDVQRGFECCGVNGPEDWAALEPTTTVGTTLAELHLPVSCCPIEYGAITDMKCTPEQPSLFKTGCAEAFGAWVQSHARSIGVAGVFLVLMQAATVAGALWIAKMSRQTEL